MIAGSLQDNFFSLIRLGIGHSIVARLPEDVDWKCMAELAAKQGLSAVMVDGVEMLKEGRPSREVLLQWIGETLQGYENRYELYQRAIVELADWYNDHGLKMMILKGYACALNWPKPNHRPCGDIDIWLFGKQKEADALLAKEKGIEIDNSHQHHTIFYWRNFMVENHFDFIDVYHRKSSPRLEAIFKELGQDDSNSVELYGRTVYIPNVNLHALFLVYHTMLHFVSTEMSIRQILDWGLFVQKHTKEIDWEWLWKKVNEFHLQEFLNIINAICVEDLGFESSIFHGAQFNLVLKGKVLDDTMMIGQMSKEPNGFFHRILFRYRRWKSHEWKHNMCFEESMWSIFWSGVWGHILKPKSI